MPKFLGSEFSTAQIYLISLLQQLAGIPGSLLGTWVIESKLGRRGALALGFVLSSLASFVFLLSSDLGVVLVVVFIMNFGAMLSFSALFTMTPESYPTGIRNLANGWGCGCARIGGLISPPLTGWLLDLLGSETIPLVLFAVCFGASGLTGLLLAETKGRISKDYNN